MRESFLTGKDLLEIVERASTIDERMGEEFVPAADNRCDDLVHSRLKNWCSTAALDDWNGFLKRLSFDGLDVETVKRALGKVRLKEKTPLPEWAAVLEETVKISLAMAENSIGWPAKERFIDNAEPLPFEDILAPFVLAARHRLTTLTGQAYGLLSSRAHAVLERSLLERLAYFSARALFLDFSIFRHKELPPALLQFEQLFEPESHSVYRQFAGMLHAGGLVAFFKEYAVLARLLASAISLWAGVNAEFIVHLASDRADIQQVFGCKENLGEVEQIQPLSPDPLRGEKVVLALTFASGLKLVYKPKDLGVEEAFFNLLACLNQMGITLPFRLLRLLNLSTHGWIEYVEHLPCKTPKEARRYYARSGMLLCLVYVLKGMDCHYKNIIACGESPMLVDMETFLQHQVRPGFRGVPDEPYLAYEQIMNSVIHTGLLPIRVIPKDGGAACDISGLGGEGLNDPNLDQGWVNVNTNAMAPGHEVAKEMRWPNIPFLDGAPLCLEDYNKELIAGFRQMYRFLEHRRDALLAPDGPLQAMARLKVRFIFRPTRVYTSIFRGLCDPKYLRDGADYSIRLDLLARKLVAENRPGLEPAGKAPRLLPVLAAEKQAVQMGKIPYFTAHTRSADMEVAPGQVIKQCFSAPSFEMVVARVKNLGSEDMERQIGFIRASLTRGTQKPPLNRHVIERSK